MKYTRPGRRLCRICRSRAQRQRQTPGQYGSASVVTVAQRSYSFGLLEVYGTKFAGRRFLKRARAIIVCVQKLRTKSCRKDFRR